MDTAENPGGHCDGHRSRPILAKSGILPSSTGDTDRQSSHTVCTHQPPPITISSTWAPSATQTLEDISLQNVRVQYVNQGISDEAIDIIMSSCRPETKKVYATYIRKWREITAKRTQDPSSAIYTSVPDYCFHKIGNNCHLTKVSLACFTNYKVLLVRSSG